MKIQEFQSTQSINSHASLTKASAQVNLTTPAHGASDVYSGERANRASKIMAGQDLSNISREDLKALTDKLYETGVITGEQRLDLTAPYVDQLNTQMQSIINPSEKRNFLLDLSAALDSAKQLRPNDTSSIAHLQKVSNLANSLAALSGKI